MSRRAPGNHKNIYQLYEHAALCGPTQFRARAAEVCAASLEFDALFWGIVHSESPVPASLWQQHLRGDFLGELEPPDWQEFEAALFTAAGDEDPAIAAFNPTRGTLGKMGRVRRYFQQAGMMQGLALRCAHPSRPVHSLILLLRRDGRPAFSAEDGERLRGLAPHLGGALALALRGLANVDQLLQSLGRPSRHSAAVLDDRGALLEADEKFETLLRAHFPAWRGGRLPFPLPPLDRAGAEEHVVASLHVRGTRNEGLTVVHLREINPMDLLSPRERDVVRAIASGLTLKSIGKRLDISPSTVANHAARIYAKLGIHSRDRLVEMLKLLNRKNVAAAQTEEGDKAG